MLDSLIQSVGEFRNIYTLVDFYEYIKTVEYLICVAFFIAFTKFFKFIHSDDAGDRH